MIKLESHIEKYYFNLIRNNLYTKYKLFFEGEFNFLKIDLTFPVDTILTSI